MNLEKALSGNPVYVEAGEYLLSKGVEILSGLTKVLETIAYQTLGRPLKEKERVDLKNTIQRENEKFSLQWQEVIAIAIKKWGADVVKEILQDFPEVFARLQAGIK